MNSGVLPPAPSWYLSNILSSNDDGLLAYGTRNEIVLFRILDEEKQQYSVVQHAHSERLNCLVFSPNSSSFKNCIASCGDDGLVRIWDAFTHELKLNHSGHQEGLKIVGLDWSSADPNLVVSTNDVGNIVCWDLPSNTIRRISVGQKISPVCLACCPHDKDIVAIGAKTGVISINNVKGEGKVLFRVKGHEGDVVSLSWCPVPDNVYNLDSNEKGNNKTLLLASGGADKCIFIWKAGVDMRYSSKLYLPSTPMGQAFRRKLPAFENSNSNFLCVRWVDPYQILSGSLFGELLSWDVRKIVSVEKSNKPEAKKKGHIKVVQPRLLHSAHTKGLFSINCPISTERNIDAKEDKRLIWTTALDRHLTAYNISSGQTVLDLPCFGNVIYSLAVSPVDNNNLAIGTGDGKIFIWNMTTNVMFKDVFVHWKKINGKVMALAWHPTDEFTLAFGTGDGRIGLVTAGHDKNPVILKLYHHRAVYRLVWAPPMFPTGTTKPTKLVLYSVGDRELVQYCPETPDKDPVKLESVLKAADISAGMKSSPRSDVAFKHDFSVFAIANENGSVHVLSCEDQKRLHTIYPHKKGINSLVWHPPTVFNDSNSPYKNWLASGAENIKVYNIPDDKDSPVEMIASLTVHCEKIASLVWNPHLNAQLMSASYDCTVQIWDVITQTLLSSFHKHYSAVLCAVWSPLDPNIAISGSYDNTLQVWNTSKQTVAPPGKRKDFISSLNKMRQAIPLAKELAVPRMKLAEWTPNTSINSSFSEDRLQEKNKGLEDYKKRVRARAFFPVTSMNLQSPNHLDVLYKRVVQSEGESSQTNEERKNGEQDMTDSYCYLDYFGDKKAMKRLLMVEDAHFKEAGNVLLSQHNALWRGDVSEMLEEAIKKKTLSEWLVSVAPMGSFAVWAEMCQAYATQLTECGEYAKAASYLLALHKVEEAILLLADHNLYKEALAIAKSRYPEDDPTITMVMQKWGEFSSSNGQLLLAAHCFLATGDYLAASDVLVRCSDLKSLKLAALMAEKAGSHERAETLMKDCLQLGLQHANYKIVEEILEEKPEYQAWSLWLESCHVINTMKKNKKNCEEHNLCWLKQECTSDSVLDKMKPVCEKVGKEYTKLSKNVELLKIPSTDKELWYIMSGHVAMLCATYHEAGRMNLASLQHWVSALDCAYQFQLLKHDLGTPLLQLCYFFSPQGPFSPSSIFMSPCETEEEKLLMKSARAFLCAGVMHWLTNSETVKETLFSKTVDDENGNLEASDPPKEESNIKKLDWLVELLEKCQVDVLDPDSFCFFKTKTQKKLLVDTVAKDKAEQNKVSRRSVGKKDRKKKSVGKKSDNVGNVEDKAIDTKDKITDCSDEKINGVETKEDKVSGSKLNGNESNGEGILSESSRSNELNSEAGSNEGHCVNGSNSEAISSEGNRTNGSSSEAISSEGNRTNGSSSEAISSEGNCVDLKVNKIESRPPTGKHAEENGSGDSVAADKHKSGENIEVEKEDADATILLKENGSCGKPSLVDQCGGGDAPCTVEKIVCKIENNGTTNQITDVNPEPKEGLDRTFEEDENCSEPEYKSNTTEEIEKIDSFLNKFLESRISAPNPFVACSNIKSTINYLRNIDSNLAEELDEKCDSLWKSCGKDSF